MKIYSRIADVVGNTPLVKFGRALTDDSKLFAKLEFMNPTGNIMDRMAYVVLEEAAKSKLLLKGMTIVVPTCPVFGASLSMVAHSLGYNLLLVTTDDLAERNIDVLKHFNPEIVLTPAKKGLAGAYKKANEIMSVRKDAYLLGQYREHLLEDRHYASLAQEIWEDMDWDLDIFIAGIGSGGALSGTGHLLKKKNSKLKVIGVEFAPGFEEKHSYLKCCVHDVTLHNDNLLDEMMTIPLDVAANASQRLAQDNGILCGVKSGAAAAAAEIIASREENINKSIVALFPDSTYGRGQVLRDV
ncbi:MAG: pyridoxal-phosphate dependent enzyme [Lentisphaerae bacterium]|nr:pyridoxal-phosphate dependent enzyme [Lentisphaerota bacterium]MCP4100870.1 pyridoxal-phosphate dependent enzyme [Lentisphaerota bacterium]